MGLRFMRFVKGVAKVDDLAAWYKSGFTHPLGFFLDGKECQSFIIPKNKAKEDL